METRTNLHTYYDYKRVDLIWLNKVPSHWEVVRGKQLFNSKKQVNKHNECNNILSLTLRGVVNNSINNPEGLVPKDYGTYQIFEKDDLVFKLIDLENYNTSRVGIVHEKGIMSPAYIRLIKQQDLNIKYFYYQYYDLYLRRIYNQLGAGVRSTLNSTDLLSLSVLVPPRSEQNHIVKYLDFHTSKINKFIRVKKKVISVLKEYKQSIINEAVTKGINPYVKMKPSGIDWLGDIPEHWEIKRGKFFFRETDVRSQVEGDELLTVSHITGITPRSQKNVNMFKSESTIGYKKCVQNNIAVNTMWAWMGAIGISNYNGVISPSYHTYETIKDYYYSNNYLDYLLRISKYVSQYRKLSTGIRSSRLRLYPDKFLSISFIRPPIEEQKEIEKYIESATSVVNDSIIRNEKEIELINEYRTRLISDVVTGRVDVSHINVGSITEELDYFEEDEEIYSENTDLEECEV